MTAITYRLPHTELVITGVVKTTTDALKHVGGKPARSAVLASSEVKLVTSADLKTLLTVEPPTGKLTTYKGSFGLAPDGRLTSGSSDVTSEVGTIVKSIASLAGTALAIAALEEPGARPHNDAEDEGILAAYAADYPEEHGVFTGLRSAAKKLAARMDSELSKAADGGGDLTGLRRLRALKAIIDERLALADAHFRTWRSSKVETVDESFELRVPITEVPASVDTTGWGAGGRAPAEGTPSNLEQLWKWFGLGVEASWLEDGTAAKPREGGTPEKPRTERSPTSIGNKTDEIYTRVPESLELRVVKAQGDKTVETSRRRALVADDRSQVKAFKLNKSRLGRKSLTLAFDADGFLSSVGVEGSSPIGAGLTAATGAVEGFTGGVEGGTKAFAAVRTAGRASLDAELARVKSEVELRQQRLLASGLDATSADAVELQRLQQLQGILEAQTAITNVDPALVTDLAKRSGGDMAWYQPPPPPPPPEPQVIRILVGHEGETELAPATAPAVSPDPAPDLGGPRAQDNKST